MNYTPEQTSSLPERQFKYLEVALQEQVLRLRLNRPDRKNALNRTLLNELAFALHYARHEKGVRAVRLGARGDVFCSGADLKGLMAPVEAGSDIPEPKGEILLAELFRQLHRPCIATLTGDVYAGGFLLLCGCTHVIAAENVRLGLPEVKRGIFPFQVLAALAEIIPPRHALDWCLRGRTLDAAEALQLGLVTQLVPAGEVNPAAERLETELKKGSPTAIRMGLEAWAHLREAEAKDQHQYLMHMLMQNLQTEDAREGIAAFKEKREPVWKEARSSP